MVLFFFVFDRVYIDDVIWKGASRNTCVQCTWKRIDVDKMVMRNA